MVSSITFITGNASKAEQLSKYLGSHILHRKIDLIEVQSLEVVEVITHKVMEAYQQINSPVIVDDVSLTIHAFGRLPGPFIKYFASEIGNKGICKLVSTIENKSATAVVAIGYYDGKEVKVCLGEIKGKISTEPAGQGGFGWDAIFIPDGYTKTRAAMPEEDYDATSPRKFALDQLQSYLKSL